MTPRTPRAAKVNVLLLTFLASVVALVGLVVLLAWDTLWPAKQRPAEPLVVYCAVAVKPPMETLARAYEERYGQPIRLQYDNSQTLLTGFEVTRRGDLYVPADDSYLEVARDKGLVDEMLPLARMVPVLAVRRENPKKIYSLDDVLAGGVRVAHANPDASAVGKVSKEALVKSGQWDAYARRVTVYKPTVNDVANDVLLGTVDAGIVWNATLPLYPDLQEVPVPALAAASALLQIGVLRCSARPAQALRFARYVAARDRGLPEFAKRGYAVVEGEPWAEPR